MATNKKWLSTRIIEFFGERYISNAGSSSGGGGIIISGGLTPGKFVKPGSKTLLATLTTTIGGVDTTTNYTFSVSATNYNYATDPDTGKLVPANPSLPYGGWIKINGQSEASVSNGVGWSSTGGPASPGYWSNSFGNFPPPNVCANIKTNLDTKGRILFKSNVQWQNNTDDGWGLKVNGIDASELQVYVPAGWTGCAEQGFTQPPLGTAGGFANLIVYIGVPSDYNNRISLFGEEEQTETDAESVDNLPPNYGNIIGGNPVIPGPEPTITPSTTNTIILNVSPNPVSFANTDVGTYSSQVVSIQNKGTGTVEIEAIEPSGEYSETDQPFSIEAEFPFTLLPNQIQLVKVYFTPKEGLPYQDTFLIKVKDNEFGVPFSADGVGVVPPEPEEPPTLNISLEGNSPNDGNLDFADTTANSAEQELVLKINNNGADPSKDNFRLISIEIIQGAEQNFSIVSGGVPIGGTWLSAGQTRNLILKFKPLSEGNKTATIRILSTATTGDVDEEGFSYSILSGKGVPIVLPTLKIEFESQFGVYTYTDPQTTIGKVDFGTEVDIQSEVYQKVNFFIRNVGTGTVKISGFNLIYSPSQNPAPFILDFGQYNFEAENPTPFVYIFKKSGTDEPIIVLEPGQESSPIGLWFKPVVVEEFNGIAEPRMSIGFPLDNDSVKHLPFTGKGRLFQTTPEEPEGPTGPVTPETPPDEVFDGVPPEDNPGETPGDGYSSACVTRTCAIPYLYKYTVNQTQPTQ